ncbi:MAG: hypothetical protein J6Z06_03430 [Lachnospiraceae bacterium]|nr:hypothetical protein [Lachnospiraceae bacterium]
MENIRRKTLRVILSLFVSAMLLMACGKSEGVNAVIPRGQSAATVTTPEEEATEDTETETKTQSDTSGLFMIESFDGDEEFVILKNITSTRQVRYSYNLDTKFLNKYGDAESWSSFTPGKVVEITETASMESALASIQLSPRVWVQENITNYDIDLSRDILKIADSNYQLTPQTEVFSHGIASYITDIGADDELRVVGQDKEIYSVTVTSGHGYISLLNTSLFEGSLITVGTETVALITENMVFEVPEGTYDVTVANNGYGGTKTVTVERNQTLTLDLNELKGEGPKFCKITFQCQVPDVIIYLDGKTVDVNKQHEVQYGRHSLVVTAEGYDTWSRTLFANSANATIVLDLEDENTSKNNNGNNNSNNNNGSNNSSNNNSSNNNSNSGNNNSNNTNSNNNNSNNSSGNSSSGNSNGYTEKDAQLDYLSTISNMISNMVKN